jgi:carboxymethylenebutenolidase
MHTEEKIQISVPAASEKSSTEKQIMDAFLVDGLKYGPPSGSKIRAVVLIQEAFGVNHHMRQMCHKVAEEGYVAVAPEFFHRSGRGLEFGYGDFAPIMPIFSQLTNAGVRADLEGTFSYLKEHHQISPAQIAVMGYCFGGLAAMISATSQPIGTAIAYYGGGMLKAREGMGLAPVIEDFKNIQCPVLLHFGADDTHIPMEEVDAVRAELERQKKKHEVIIYPGAGHGFSNNDRPSYNPEATHRAWEKSLSWLKSI